MIIGKVWKRNANGKYPQKIVTIPQSSNIEAGDHVMINKIKGEQKIADINLSAIGKTKTESANQTHAKEILGGIYNDE